jgi:hypothetical protein
MRWIESNGGPFVLVADDMLNDWRGVEGPSGREPDSVDTDYDRACAVTEYVEAIPCGSSRVLVLGDEPFRTSWRPQPFGGDIVRWVYSDSEQSIVAALETGAVDAALEKSGIQFAAGASGTLWLFDAARPGKEVGADALRIEVGPRVLEVTTGLVDAGEEVRFLVHRLVALSDGAGLSRA